MRPRDPPPVAALGPPRLRSISPSQLRVRARSTSLGGILKELATAVALFEEKGRKKTLLQRRLMHSRVRG